MLYRVMIKLTIGAIWEMSGRKLANPLSQGYQAVETADGVGQQFDRALAVS